MKKCFLLAIAAGCFMLTKAQVSFNVKAGLNIANVGGKGIEGTSALLGFNAGVQAGFKISNAFTFTPELVYSAQGAKVPVEMQGEGDQIITVNAKAHLNYLNLPLQVQYNSPIGFFAETGPQIGYLLSAKLKGAGETSDIKDQFKKFDFGWALGVGYVTKWKVGFNARYQLGLSSLSKSSGSSTDGKAYNRVLQVGVFYILR